MGTVDIKLDHRVELARPLQNFKTVTTFVFLRHKVQILVLVDNLVSRHILLCQNVGRDKRFTHRSFVFNKNVQSVTVIILSQFGQGLIKVLCVRPNWSLNLQMARTFVAFKARHLIAILDTLSLSCPVILNGLLLPAIWSEELLFLFNTLFQSLVCHQESGWLVVVVWLIVVF